MKSLLTRELNQECCAVYSPVYSQVRTARACWRWLFSFTSIGHSNRRWYWNVIQIYIDHFIDWSLLELDSNPEQIRYFHLIVGILINYLKPQKLTDGSLLELKTIRDGQLILPRLFFSCQQLSDIIDYLCTSWFIVHALFFWNCVHFCHVTIRMFVCCLYCIGLCTYSTNKHDNNNYPTFRTRWNKRTKCWVSARFGSSKLLT